MNLHCNRLLNCRPVSFRECLLTVTYVLLSLTLGDRYRGKHEKVECEELQGNWGGGGGNRELMALTLPRVFLVIKVDCRKFRVLNSEEIRVIGKKKLKYETEKRS